MSEPRQSWLEFIRSPSRESRYLSSRGLREHVTTIEPERLQYFLEHLANRQVSLSFLAHVFFLTDSGLRSFLRSLPQLLRTISAVRTNEYRDTSNAVVKVAWGRTMLMRNMGRLTEGQYVSHIGEKSRDTPENRLLKLFLVETLEVLVQTSRLVGTGALLRELKDVKRAVEQALSHPYIRDIHLVRKASTRMRQRARRHRNRHYSELVHLQRRLEELKRQSRLAALLQLIIGGWIEPISDDDLFELYGLMLVLEVLEKDLSLGQPTEYGLLLSNRRSVAKFVRTTDGTTVEVFFDQSPVELFGSPSEYLSIVNQYDGFSGAAHRPDMIIRVKRPESEVQHVLVECKKTHDDGYKRNSIYKVLGYLRDFEDLWAGQPRQALRAILLLPDKVTLKPGPARQQELAIVSSDDRPRLANLLGQLVDGQVPSHMYSRE